MDILGSVADLLGFGGHGANANQEAQVEVEAKSFHQLLQDLRVVKQQTYCSIDQNEAVVEVVANRCVVMVRKNNGGVRIKGRENLLVVHENAGTIDVENERNAVRIVREERVGVVRNRGARSNTLNWNEMPQYVLQPLQEEQQREEQRRQARNQGPRFGPHEQPGARRHIVDNEEEDLANRPPENPFEDMDERDVDEFSNRAQAAFHPRMPFDEHMGLPEPLYRRRRQMEPNAGPQPVPQPLPRSGSADRNRFANARVRPNNRPPVPFRTPEEPQMPQFHPMPRLHQPQIPRMPQMPQPPQMFEMPQMPQPPRLIDMPPFLPMAQPRMPEGPRINRQPGLGIEHIFNDLIGALGNLLLTKASTATSLARGEWRWRTFQPAKGPYLTSV